MNIETVKALAWVFIQWGAGFVVFGLATIAIGAAILACLDMETIKKISKYINS